MDGCDRGASDCRDPALGLEELLKLRALELKGKEECQVLASCRQRSRARVSPLPRVSYYHPRGCVFLRRSWLTVSVCRRPASSTGLLTTAAWTAETCLARPRRHGAGLRVRLMRCKLHNLPARECERVQQNRPSTAAKVLFATLLGHTDTHAILLE